MKLYGIPNCSTVKKARAWLDAREIAYEFHDFKKHGVPTELMNTLMKIHGWEAMLNRSGTTWRKLDDARKGQVTDEKSALTLMVEQPSVIKRPILDRDDQYQVGFTEDNYAAFFGE